MLQYRGNKQIWRVKREATRDITSVICNHFRGAESSVKAIINTTMIEGGKKDKM